MLNTEYQNSSASIAWTYNTLFHVVCVSVKCIELSHTGQLYSPWHITAVIITTQGLHSPQKQNLVVWTQSVNTVCSLGCQSAACKFLGVDVKLVSVDLRQYWVLEHNTHKVKKAVMTLYQVHWNTTHTRWEWLMTQYQVHWNTIHTRWEWLSWHSIRYTGTQYTQGENGCHDTLSCTLEHNNRRWEWLSLHSIKIKHK